MATFRGPNRGNRGNQGNQRNQRPLTFSSHLGVPNRDETVHKVEGQLLGGRTSTTSTTFTITSTTPATATTAAVVKKVDLPARPSYGTKGTALLLWANYFSLQVPSQLVLYQYSLSVKPLAVGKKLAHIVRLSLQSPDLQPLQQDIVTDFKSTVIAKKQFQKKVVDVHYRAEGEDEPLQNARQYSVQLQPVKTLSVADVIRYLGSTDLSSQDGEKLSVVQALNILINHYAKSSNTIATIGVSKNFSLIDDAQQTFDLGFGLTARRGFFTSVRAATARMLLNVNVCHSAFYQPIRLSQLITSFAPKFLDNPRKVEAFLKRLRIKTTHLREKKNRAGQVIIRAKTIYGLANVEDGKDLAHPPRVQRFGAGPDGVEFWLDSDPSGEQSSSGRYVSVHEYFRDRYSIRIHDLLLPVINVGTARQPSYLPAQVCVVLPGQVMRHQLSSLQTQRMIQFAVQSPADSATSIVSRGLHTVTSADNTSTPLNNFGVKISPNLITVEGRLLAEPKVIYGPNKQTEVRGGSWNMVPQNSPPLRFYTPVKMTKWACISISMPNQHPNAPGMAAETANEFVEKLTTVLQSTGIGIEAGTFKGSRAFAIQEIDDPALEERFKLAVQHQIPLLLVILPAGPTPLYNRIKKLGDTKYGIHTICSVGSKIERAGDQYLRNVALKVNLKLGGDNHVVQRDRLGLIAEDKTMVVGIDVTHPSPGSLDTAPSVSAMVASVNWKLSHWPGTLAIQTKSRQEMVSDLTGMLKSRLALWRQQGKHASYPENILVYRDGVSEGQYATVLAEELPQLRAACKELYPAPDQAKGLPRITIVIVGKRHHTRFYVTKATEGDRSGNPKAGTVVDRGVTEARSWDFFLQSHAAIKGTARPAHYYVLLDEIFRERYGAKGNVADELQTLTQSMCYVFGRATKAVSYCTPAYYADILCERARCYLSHVFESPTNSSAGSADGDGSQHNATHQESIGIHGRLTNSMFYI